MPVPPDLKQKRTQRVSPPPHRKKGTKRHKRYRREKLVKEKGAPATAKGLRRRPPEQGTPRVFELSLERKRSN